MREDRADAGGGVWSGGLRTENARLRVEVERLRGELEEARRAGKRQSAPFSKGDPKEHPGRGGRRSGSEHGRHAHRPVPDHVDEEIEVPLPDCCPECGGLVDGEGFDYQYQEDLVVPVRSHVRRFRVAKGRCRCCRRRLAGRHPLQTSDAVGAAAVQVGPNALALACELNKELGVPAGKVARILLQMCGIQITAGGVHQALARVASRASATYQALVLAVRSSAVLAPDETGWRIAGRKSWLWAFVGENVTVYLIAEGRGYEHAAGILGEDFCGVLERDGWAPYRRFQHARHQTCLAHLLRRCNEMIGDSRAGQARVPHQVKALLLDALALREQRRNDADVIEGHAVEIHTVADPERHAANATHGQQLALSAARAPKALLASVAAVARRATDLVRAPAADDPQTAAVSPDSVDLDDMRADLDIRLQKLLAGHPTHPPNRRLLAHLKNEQDNLFTFLDIPGVQATNWRAEQAIRPAVVNRKNWGGNRTRHGADTQQILMSVIRTARQQNTNPVALLADLQRQPTPTVTPALALPTPATKGDQPAATRGP
jgi:transposase